MNRDIDELTFWQDQALRLAQMNAELIARLYGLKRTFPAHDCPECEKKRRAGMPAHIAEDMAHAQERIDAEIRVSRTAADVHEEFLDVAAFLRKPSTQTVAPEGVETFGPMAKGPNPDHRRYANNPRFQEYLEESGHIRAGSENVVEAALTYLDCLPRAAFVGLVNRFSEWEANRYGKDA